MRSSSDSRQEIEDRARGTVVRRAILTPKYLATSIAYRADRRETRVPNNNYVGDPHGIAIAGAARRLMELRDRWLNPPEWMDWVDESIPGYPKRPVARGEAAAKKLKARTLTNLYSARPQWLPDAHAALDAAVAEAYRWNAGVSEDEVLRDLLTRNLSGGEPI